MKEKDLRSALLEWPEYGLVEAAAEVAYRDAGDHPRAMSAALEAGIAEGLRQFDLPETAADHKYRCRCGETHRGDYALYDFEHHECFHDSQLLYLAPEDQDHLVCPECGKSFFVQQREGKES